MKIAIIGHSGGGKSTLARFLAQTYQLPLLHLDQLYFLPNWQARPEKEVIRDLRAFLDRENDWVIDGIYSKFLFYERLEKADTIIFLDFPRWISFYRILKRYWTYHGKIRPSAPKGCEEKIDWAFIKFALIHSRRKERIQLFQSICHQYKDKIRIIRNQRELDNFYKEVRRG